MLLTQVRRLAPPAGQLAIWALGQVGYSIKGGATVVVIDPYRASLAFTHAHDF